MAIARTATSKTAKKPLKAAPVIKTKRTAKVAAKKTAKPTRTRKVKEPETVTPLKEKLNASKLLQRLADDTGIDKRDVKLVVTALGSLIKGAVCKKGVGEFTIPGLIKIRTKRVPAKPARKGTNPFTGEPMTFKAKPATTKVRVLPMKALKEIAAG